MLFQLLLALALTRVEPQTLQPPNLNRIEEIRVSGNLRLPKETIKYNLQTREGNQVYVGGDTQGVANLEYRIPVAGHVLTLAPFFDLGNAWVLKKDQLTRQIINAQGQLIKVPVRLLPGTNSSIRTSTGMELQILLPVINVPFRVIYAINPNRLDRSFVGPTTGSPFGIHEKFSEFKFTVGRTF